MRTFLNKHYLLHIGLIFLIFINFSLVISENLNVNVRVVEDLESTSFMAREPAVGNGSFFERGISYIKLSRNNALFALAILFLILFFVIFIKLRKHKKND